MKQRKGFVSNSSSSSFVILKQDDKLSREELVKKSKEILLKYCDYDDEWLDKRINPLADKNQYILLIQSIDYGAEEAAEKLARKLCEMGGIKNISFEWSEE
jgi:hypothetical protein